MSNNVSRSRGTRLALLHHLVEKGFSDAHEALSPFCSLIFSSSSSSKLESTCQFADSRRAATAYTQSFKDV